MKKNNLHLRDLKKRDLNKKNQGGQNQDPPQRGREQHQRGCQQLPGERGIQIRMTSWRTISGSKIHLQ